MGEKDGQASDAGGCSLTQHTLKVGPFSSRTIESQKKGNAWGRTENGSNIKPKSRAKKTASPVNKSVQIHNTVSPQATAAANGQNIDERLRAARERREEQQRLIASRELSRLEREQRAKRYHEQQVEERKKKLLEQRLREERRRAAVEEKRRQRLQEEKERYESVVRRTLEKSQRAQKSLSQDSRGRKVAKNVSFHSITTTPHKPQQHSSSVQKKRSVSPSPSDRRLNLAQIRTAKQPDIVKKNSNRSSSIRSPGLNSSVTPVTQSKKASPSPDRTPRRSVSRRSTPLQLELPPVPEEGVAVRSSVLARGNTRPVRTSARGQTGNMKEENAAPVAPSLNLPHIKSEHVTGKVADKNTPQVPPHPAPQPPEVVSRPSAGTTDKEEASRLLAEKRREARLQREREEQVRLQKEEAERQSREELEHRRAEERARQQAEAQRLIEEKRRREEEEQRGAEEERAQAMKEAALLQKQREEEQAREMEKAEKMKEERDMLAQKEEAARQERKKRLEEIMRRTRRTDSPDTRSLPVRILPNEAQPKENTEPVHSNNNIEHVVKLPVGTKSSQLGLSNEEDMVPVVAFKERRSLRTLTGLEKIQTHQRAEVI
ncbi:MAP7 domain-containing protein 2-like isoform X4 [Solea solea]|uniref:MAP7 domain-containing protein 2-like isoform X4 n=1 Tax=Solea solea TaxID=90069 RepID=UPI00272A7259|nr:MAP7 domain-containing protein 2-like isoform X4 [Solea solea]